MLVLSRQRDETIMIGDDVEITVVDIRGDKVRIGITAPPEIAVHRKEVYEAIKAENVRAAHVTDGDVELLTRALKRPSGQDKTVERCKASPLTPRTVQPPGATSEEARRRRA